MNVHKIQSQQGSAEVATLMRPAANIVTAQRNAPIASIVQDGLIAAYRATNTWKDGTETMVTKDLFFDCITAANISLSHYNKIMNSSEIWYPQYIKRVDNSGTQFSIANKVPGKLMLSCLFPSTFDYQTKDEYDDGKIVKKGVLIKSGCILPNSGPLCKQTIGSKHNSVLHVLWKYYSPERSLKFITQTQMMTDTYIGLDGFSMGLSDCILLPNSKVKEVLSKIRQKVDNLMKNYSLEQEAKINTELNSAMGVGAKIALEYMNKGDRNNVDIMRKSGAKGSIANLTHKMVFIGQQNVEGKRIPNTISNGQRTLPIYKKNDHSQKPRGFIENNYTNGLTPGEMFHHITAGRDGIVTISCKTADSGYAHKCIGRKMDDCVVRVDGSVRNASGGVVQYLYGDVGLSPKKVVTVSSLNSPFFVNPKDIANKVNGLVSETLKNSYKLRKLSEDEINEICTYIRAGYPTVITPITNVATSSLRQALAFTLRDVEVYEDLITKFSAEVINAFEMSKIQHGDAVGLVGSSSIGEPTTQLSIPFWEKILLSNKGKVHNVQIGSFVDFVIGTVTTNEVYMKLFSEEEYFVPTVNKYQKVEWKPIKGVVKHFTTDTLLKVTTKSGRCITTTNSHSHITFKDGISFVKASELKVGDKIPLCKNLNITSDIYALELSNKKIVNLDFNLGWSIGTILSNKPFDAKVFKERIRPHVQYFESLISQTQNLYSFYFSAVKPFKIGILVGFFDAGEYTDRLKCVGSSKVLSEISLLLMTLGINSVINNETIHILKEHTQEYFNTVGSERFIYRNETVQPLDEIDNLPCDKEFNECGVFMKEMEKFKEAKEKGFLSRRFLQNRYFGNKETDIVWDEITHIESLISNQFVYDLVVEDNHTFMLHNGLFTHNTLNTARLAGFGEKDVSIGVPRFCEILNTTQSKHAKYPSCKVYTDVPKEECKRVFECVKIGTVVQNYEIFYTTSEPNCGPIKIVKYKPYKPEWWVDLSLKLGLHAINKEGEWVAKLTFDYKQLFLSRIKLSDIAKKIKEAMDEAVCCICSPEIIGEMYVFPDFEYFEECIDKQNKETFEKKLRNSFDFYICRDFLQEYLYDIQLSGIANIEKIRFDKSGKYFETKGTNLLGLLASSVDTVLTGTNDLWEIYNTLGIEATRSYMFQEVTRIISFDGTYVNPCHIQLLIDCMTCSGIPTSTRRYGISRNVGPIAKLAFEQHPENATESGIFTEHDNLISSASTVMCGLVAPSGTGVVTTVSADKLPVKTL